MAKEEKYGVGTIHENKKGLKFEIIEKISKDHRKIKFLDSGYLIEKISIAQISFRKVKDHSHKIKISDVFKTKEGYNLIVVNYINTRNIYVKFEGFDEYVFKTNDSSLRSGSISNPYHKSLYGVGYFGVGVHKSRIDGVKTNEYNLWRDIIKRCYNKADLEKQPTYKNVSVCKEWHNFQNFAEWYDNNYPKNVKNIKLHLDKDLMQDGTKNKIYSKETCCFLPHKINSFLSSNTKRNMVGLSSKYLGVSFDKTRGKWCAGIRDFSTEKHIRLGFYETEIEAHEVYMKARALKVEEVKSYLRSLNYLPEEVIQLVK